MSWHHLFAQAKLIEKEADTLVGELPQGEIDEETIAKYSQIARFVKQYLREKECDTSSMFADVKPKPSEDDYDMKGEEEERDETINEEGEAEEDFDCDQNMMSYNSSMTNHTDTYSSVPIVDSIADSFARNVDLNTTNSIQAIPTVHSNKSKRMHPKLERHVYNKIGGKLRLKPIAASKKHKFRLRTFTTQRQTNNTGDEI